MAKMYKNIFKYLFLCAMLSGCATTNNHIKYPYTVSINKVDFNTFQIVVRSDDQNIIYEDVGSEMMSQAKRLCSEYDIVASDFYTKFNDNSSYTEQVITIHCQKR